MAQLIELDASGDFIIELSSRSSEKKTHLLVSSKVLTLLSPVLGKVFDWESRARADGEKAKAKTPIFPLPDDDEEVFTMFCHMAHHKMESIPDTLEPDTLAKFAELCKKYDCIRPFTHSIYRWLQLDLRPHSFTDLNKLLFAAYTLDIGDAFERISRRILFHQRGYISIFPGFPNHGFDHSVLLDEFSDRRRKLADDLMDVMLSPLTKPLGGSCDQSTLMIGKYLKELKRLGVWPRFHLYFKSVSEILGRAIDEPIRQSCDSMHCRFCSERDFKFADELSKAKAAFVQKNDGLCLKSIRIRQKG